MSLNVEYVFKVLDRFSGPLDRIGRVVDKSSDALSRAAKNADKFGRKMTDMGKGMSMKVTAPLSALNILSIKTAANFETMGLGFEVMLGSAEKGKQVMDDLKKFSAKTPFQIEGLAKSARMLLSSGKVTQDQLIDKLQLLGDMASGAQIPIAEMTAIFNKSMGRGLLQAEELNQANERGIPVVALLAKEYGTTTEKIYEMASKGKIKFSELEMIMKSMTSKGGMFFNMMEKQSKTLSGVFSTLSDNVRILSSEYGSVLVEGTNLNENIVSLTEKIQGYTKSIQNMHPFLKSIVVGFIIFLSVIGPIILGLGQFAMAMHFLGKSIIFTKAVSLAWAGVMAILTPVIAGVRVAMLLLNAAFMANPIWFLIGAAMILVPLLNILYLKFKPFRDFIDGIIAGVKKLISIVGDFFTGGDKKITFETVETQRTEAANTANTAAKNKGGFFARVFGKTDVNVNLNNNGEKTTHKATVPLGGQGAGAMAY